MSNNERYSVTGIFGSSEYSAMRIEDGSPEDLALEDYYKCHDLLPKNYMLLKTEEVAVYGDNLLQGSLGLEERKRAIMILAHHGGPVAQEYLQLYAEIAEPELEGWLSLALNECKMFTPQDREQRRARSYLWN